MLDRVKGWMRWGGQYRTARAYQGLFLAEDGSLRDEAKVVLADLGRFCHGFESTASLDEQGRVDAVAMVQREGRRVTLMRIYTYLGLDLARMISVENEERAIQETGNA